MNAQEAKTATLNCISTINAVDNFDPTALAVEYTDFNNGATSKRLPVEAQLAWFRLRYPDGRIAVEVKPGDNGFIAKARIYKDYKDQQEHYLAEAEVFRAYDSKNPTISPRAWAQTAAVGIALRNAGYGLQFQVAGEIFDHDTASEIAGIVDSDNAIKEDTSGAITPEASEQASAAQPQAQGSMPHFSSLPSTPASESPPKEDPLELAMKMPCPIGKYKGKTLGDLIMLDPSALAYIAKSAKYESAVVAGAMLICEHALKKAG